MTCPKCENSKAGFCPICCETVRQAPDNQLLSLEETIQYCLENKEFMEQYKRVMGVRLGSGSPIEQMIDKATGFKEKEAKDLFNFIRDYVWIPSQINLIK